MSRLDPKSLRVNSLEGVKAIVEALGGIWKKSNLESKFERFERARNEFRAYILLRNSALSAEDKKRLIVESSGSLNYRDVVSNLKLLGSKFFQEVRAGKVTGGRTKTYEANAFLAHDTMGGDSVQEDAVFQAEVWTEEDMLEQLANEGDEDAALILDYEQSMLDAILGDADLACRQRHMLRPGNDCLTASRTEDSGRRVLQTAQLETRLGEGQERLLRVSQLWESKGPSTKDP